MKKNVLLYLFIMTFWACKSDQDSAGNHEHNDNEEHQHQHDEGYQKEPSGIFDKHGISFSIPEDWSILEGEIPGGGQYISVEKTGTDESGRYSISILQGGITSESLLESVKTQLREGMKPTGNEISFTSNQKERYNSLETISCKHSFTNQGLAFDGVIRVFNCKEKIINMITIGAKADAVKNQSGFDLIDQTFTCK